MIELRLTIPAVPVAQPRQQHRIMRGKSGQQFVANYTPKNAPVNAFKATVAQVLQVEYQGAPLEAAIALDLVFVFPRPARLIWSKRPMPRVRHTSRPDRDNLEKSVMDALNGLLWRDDSQVCAGSIEKWYAAGDEQPHVEIAVRTLEDEPAAKPGRAAAAPVPTLFDVAKEPARPAPF